MVLSSLEKVRARTVQILDEAVTEPTLNAQLSQVLSEPGKVLALPESAIFSWSAAVIKIGSIVGVSTPATLDCAIAVDFFATAADIFDDLADQDNHSSSWSVLATGEQLSLALLLWQLSINLLHELQSIDDFHPSFPVLTLFNKFATQSCLGQSRDVFSINPISIEDSFQLAGQKSGSLLALCCALASLSSGASLAVVNQMSDIGQTVGLINQLLNDVKAVKNPLEKSDISLRKITLPVAYCLFNPARPPDQVITGYYLSKSENASPVEIAERLTSEGGVIYALTVVEHLKQQLISQISQLTLSAEKSDSLVEIFLTQGK